MPLFPGHAMLLASAFALSGCAVRGHIQAPGGPGPAPPAISGYPVTGADIALVETDPALVDLYAGVERDLTTSGRMRRETAPADAPFTLDDLVRNFERIALHDEYVEIGGRFLREETPALLRRWDRPIRIGVITSGSMSEAEASRSRANIAGYADRLSRLTGVDMAMAEGPETNFLVMILSSGEQAAFADIAAERFPGMHASVVGALRDTPLDTFCTAYAFSDPVETSVYASALILIRAEHPALTRLSCVHEEMAQAMGLPNDSPDARPSLFNDSLEFAFLTEHDEILLRMLYDTRLWPGISAAEARPLLPAIARDALTAHYRGRSGPLLN